MFYKKLLPFQIISNKKCELDVDKADYLLRDNYHLENSRLFPKIEGTNQKYEVRKKDIIDIFYNARASDDRKHIEFRTSDFGKIYHLFDTRSQFHIAIYKNTKCVFIEKLLAELVRERDRDSTSRLSEIDSRNIQDFVHLTDEFVCSELDNVKNPEFQRKWNALKTGSYSEITRDERPNSYKVSVEIKYAGAKMIEEDIPFYGDIEAKPMVNPQRGHYKLTSYYSINR